MLNSQKLQNFLGIVPLCVLIICLICYYVFFFQVISARLQGDNLSEPGIETLSGIGILAIFALISTALSIFAIIYFVIHTAKNPNLNNSGSIRIFWILIILILSGFGTFLYWFAEIKFKNPKPIIPK